MYDWNLIIPNFKDGIQSGDEVRVHCPFHEDENRSASINLEKGAFYCQTCGKTGIYLETQLKELFKINITDKKTLPILQAASANKRFIDLNENLKTQKYKLSNVQMLEIVKKYHYTPKVLKELQVFKNPYYPLSDFSIPTYFFGEIIGFKTYFGTAFQNKQFHIKWKTEKYSLAKMFIPFDIWRETLNSNNYIDNKTYIVAGEKDMLTMRSKGFNALTLMGGEKTLPLLDSKWFKDLEIIIIYDNDEAGKSGAKELAKYLFRSTNKIKVLTGIYEVIKEDKEDIFDFFNKYKKESKDLLDLVEKEKYFEGEKELEKEKINNKQSKINALHYNSVENPDWAFLFKIIKSNKEIELGEWNKIEMLGDNNKVSFLQYLIKEDLAHIIIKDKKLYIYIDNLLLED